MHLDRCTMSTYPHASMKYNLVGGVLRVAPPKLTRNVLVAVMMTYDDSDSEDVDDYANNDGSDGEDVNS